MDHAMNAGIENGAQPGPLWPIHAGTNAEPRIRYRFEIFAGFFSS